MNTEEFKDKILLKLNDHDNRISELSHRVSGQEEQIKIIGELSLSVRELAVNMKNMVREQISHSERIITAIIISAISPFFTQTPPLSP